MSPDQWKTVEQILDTVLDSDPHRWDDIIQRECGNDTELLTHVRKYLRHYPHIDTFLQKRAVDVFMHGMPADGASVSEIPKDFDRIDRYRLVREIAHGGMGRVFLAERDDGEYTQQVALKILHSDLDAGTMRRRFRFERQILASLNHPNIARLLDGGVIRSKSEWGNDQPYLVMEFVEGSTLKEYCSTNLLSLRERLTLFLDAAEAVGHAHRNLVIHCDIKPSNILVDEGGRVKLLDFGTSRLLDSHTEAVPGNTQPTIRHWMTPEYAAPEQIRGERATTAVDVYQLGVLLYQLITDRLPFVRTGENRRGLEEAILERTPVKPSAVVESDFLKKSIRGDLDAIVLKALRKEPDARYESVSAMIGDVRRYLSGYPVAARQATPVYRMGRYIRRHRFGVTAAAVVAASMMIVSGYYTHRLTMERDRAEEAAAIARTESRKAERTSDFLINLFESSDPYTRSGEEPTIGEFVGRAVERLDTDLADEPAVRAQLMMTLGQSYSNMGRFDEAEELLNKAVAVQREAAGSEDRNTALSLLRLGQLVYRQGDYKRARLLYEEAQGTVERVSGADHTDMVVPLTMLGNLYKRVGELSMSRSNFERALAIIEQHRGTDNVQYGRTLNDYALVLIIKGEHEEAREALERVVSIMEREMGPDHLLVGEALGNLSDVLGSLGEHDRRLAYAERYLEIAEANLGATHTTVANASINIGMAHRSLGDARSAIPMFERAREIYIEIGGPRYPLMAYALAHLGHAYRDLDEYERAIRFYTEAASIAGENRAIPHQAGILTAMGRVKQTAGDLHGATGDLERSLALFREVHPDGNWRVGWTRSIYGDVLRELGRYDEAYIHLTESYDTLRETLGVEHRNTQSAIRHLVSLFEAGRQPDRADAYRALVMEDGIEE
jgi:eukaryotic-like serine/threonine-protein kinase